MRNKKVTKNQKKNIIGLLTIVILVAGLVGFDVYQDRRHNVAIKGPVPVFGDWDPYPTDDKNVKFILHTGDTVTVKRIRYGKSYQAVRIETRDGKVGWVFPDRDCLLAE